MERSRVRRARVATVSTNETVVSVLASGVGIDEERRKVIEVRQFVTEPAYVRINAGVTKSLAPYESLRIDISVTAPCYVEEIETVQKNLEPLVAEMLQDTIDEYMGRE